MIGKITGVGVLTTALVAGFAPAASADVLVSRPVPRQCVGKAIKVGVWYRPYSAAQRGVRITVLAPRGKTVLKKSVRAPAQWRYWKVRVPHKGRYRTIYRQGRHGKPDWKQSFRTRVHRC